MALYTIGASKAAPTTGTAIAMIRPASTDDVAVREIGVFNSTAVASSVGLVRNATTGTPNASALFQAQDPGRPAGLTNLDTGWSAAATIAAVYLRKIVLPASIGAGIIWTFGPNELFAKNGATTQLLLWNFGAGTAAALEVYVVVEE